MISEKSGISPQHRGLNIYRLFDQSVGLNGILAWTPNESGLMDTAVGGVRNLSGRGMSENNALDLACDLALAMKDKSWAIPGLKIGGAKTVLYGPGKKTPQFLKAMGASLEQFNLRYGTADLPRYVYSVDVNTSVADVAASHGKLKCWSEGDPSPKTSEGVASSVLACLKMNPARIRAMIPSVYITGVCGAVGSMVAKLLIEAGVMVYGKDITTDLARIADMVRMGVIMLSGDDFPSVDVYVPCAMEHCLNKITIPQLWQVGIWAVVGSANCQLANGDEDALLLHKYGILYAVDYVVNRGGVIFVAGQWHFMKEPDRVISETGNEVVNILRLSLQYDKPTTIVAREYFNSFRIAA